MVTDGTLSAPQEELSSDVVALQALPCGSSVGIDPRLFSIGRARLFRDSLAAAGINLVSITPNLIDEAQAASIVLCSI